MGHAASALVVFKLYLLELGPTGIVPPPCLPNPHRLGTHTLPVGANGIFLVPITAFLVITPPRSSLDDYII